MDGILDAMNPALTPALPVVPSPSATDSGRRRRAAARPGPRARQADTHSMSAEAPRGPSGSASMKNLPISRAWCRSKRSQLTFVRVGQDWALCSPSSDVKSTSGVECSASFQRTPNISLPASTPTRTLAEPGVGPPEHAWPSRE